jgi:adenylate cyclase
MTGSSDHAHESVPAVRTAPRGVAKAIRFMRSNLTRRLSGGEIAAAANTPVRTLHRQFQRFTGKSPFAFHRALRLEAARQALGDTRAETDITTAAIAFGFTHLSHFTAQYRRHHGELPSATLRARHNDVVQLPIYTSCDSVSLEVFPFASGDTGPGEAAFAEATVERVIAALGRTRWLNVLGSANNLPALNETRLIFRRARYAVRGRVRFFGGRILVVIRMFEVATGRHIWGDAFEGTPEGALELQKLVTDGVASSIPALLREAEATRGNKEGAGRDPKVIDHVTQAFRATFEITQSASDYALENLDRAQLIDPAFPLARAVAAWCHALRAACCFGDEIDIDRDKARHLTALALSMDNRDPLVLAALGNASTIFGDFDLGDTLIEKCLAIDPDCMMAWQRRGWISNFRGGRGALPNFRRALALNPGGPERFNTVIGVSQAHYLAGNYEQAAEWAVQGLRERPSEAWACRIAAVAQVHCGQLKEARLNITLLRRQYPDMTVSRIINALPMGPEYAACMANDLESAGLPA